MIDAVRSILDDWTSLRVYPMGDMWVISGEWRGQSHSGARVDAISLAHDLRRITSEAVADEAPEPQETLAAPEPEVELAPKPEPEPLAEPEPEPEQAPELASEPKPEAPAIEAVIETPPQQQTIYPGLFVQVDDEARLRADVITAITLYERERLNADQDISRADDFNRAIVDYHNKGALGLLTDQDRRNYDHAMQYQQRERLIRTHADQLRDAAVKANLMMLQAMIESYREGWP